MEKKIKYSKSNAIFMIVFNNPLYVVGACLSAWTHRQFILKLNLDIKLVIMINEPILKYSDELKKYFDEIKIITLREIKLNPKYFIIDKYSDWMKYSISKWEIFKFEEFEKILFLDTDILPINNDFYNVFEFNTPAIMIRGLNKDSNTLANENGSEINLFIKTDVVEINERKDYSRLSNILKKSLDGGFVLITPNKNLYEQYINFVKISEGSSGYISKYDSGPDETTLLFFFIFYLKLPTYLIPYNYAPTPWDKFPYDKDKVKGINFISMIKPWTKLPMIQWSDENVWHRIAKKSIEKHSILTKLYIKYLIDELYRFNKNLYKNIHKSNSPYNMECVKIPKIKNETFTISIFINKHLYRTLLFKL